MLWSADRNKRCTVLAWLSAASRARLVWHRFRASASLSYAAIVSEHWYSMFVRVATSQEKWDLLLQRYDPRHKAAKAAEEATGHRSCRALYRPAYENRPTFVGVVTGLWATTIIRTSSHTRPLALLSTLSLYRFPCWQG